jgi:cystathionine gamma-synthase
VTQGASGEGGETRRAERPATLAVHAGAAADPLHGALTPPIVLSSIFRHGNPLGFEYARPDTPTWGPLERALARLDGGAGAAVFASGMAAIAAVVEQVPVGALVVGSDSSYSGTRLLLRELSASGRLRARLVDITDSAAVAAALDGAALLCLEVVTNPMLGVCDIDACIAAAHAAGARVMVDSTFSTPVLVRPLEHGADVVVHSLTKYANGHSDVLLGACVVSDEHLREAIVNRRSMVGSIAGPVETWLTLRGLRTLDVRFRRQCANAAELASRLQGHPKAEQVRYPGLASHPQHARAAGLLDGGFGAIVGLEVAGGAEAADAVCESTQVWQHATSLGGVESTLERRARYGLDAEICPPGYLRLSVGIEDVEDLWDDLSAALGSASM